MFLKSVFQNKIIGVISLILFAVLFFISGFINQNRFDIPLLGGKNADIRINLEGGNDNRVFVNGYEILPSFFGEGFNSYHTYEINNFPVYNLKIEGKNIKSAVVSVGHKVFCYDKEALKDGLQFNGKYISHGKYITDKGALKTLQVWVLSLFYNFYFYIFALFCLLIYFLNRDKISFNLIIPIITLGALLRLADLSPSFWTDELYTAFYAGNLNLPFLYSFKDPGNPPLFFILTRFYQIFSGFNEAILRILPVIFSTLTIYVIYLFVKKYSDKVSAYISSFLFAINIYGIVSAQELRCYSLLIFLTVLISYYFFKTVENSSVKNLLIYSFLSVLIINTHYFSVFILLFNFILGIFLIKDKFKFFISNLIAPLSFLPYFLMTALNKGLLDETFNKMEFPDFNFYFDTFIKFAQGKLAALIIILFLVFLIIKKKRNYLYYYSISLIFSVFIFSYLFSYIKPVSKSWYFICLLPSFVIVGGNILSYSFKNKFLRVIIILSFLFSYFSFNWYIKRERARLLDFNSYISYYKFDSFGKKSAVIVPHSKEILKTAFNLNENEILTCPDPQIAEDLIKEIEKSSKKVLYLRINHNILADFLNMGYEKFNISFIRLDKDVIIMRIVKKGL